MRKTGFWKTDGFFGRVVRGVVLLGKRVLSGRRADESPAVLAVPGAKPVQSSRRADSLEIAPDITKTRLSAADVPEISRLGPYQIERTLGKGAMGAVYLGRDPQTQRMLAIKTLALAQEFAPDELADVKARFFREAETAGRLKHPNIVAMHQVGEGGDLAYIAMEYIRGSDLVPFTKPGRLLPMALVVNIVARVADALAYAHGNNVVHRDIKPANVMYEAETDQVKVTDFGIARLTDSSRTRTGMVLGTPSYMSPEQLLGKKVDGRSDLYSLGVMLYQLLCGTLPFVGETMGRLMFKITNEAAPDIRAVNPLVPDTLVAVIEHAMHKDVLQRYPTGDAMASDLRACLPLVGLPHA